MHKFSNTFPEVSEESMTSCRTQAWWVIYSNVKFGVKVGFTSLYLLYHVFILKNVAPQFSEMRMKPHLTQSCYVRFAGNVISNLSLQISSYGVFKNYKSKHLFCSFAWTVLIHCYYSNACCLQLASESQQ